LWSSAPPTCASTPSVDNSAQDYPVCKGGSGKEISCTPKLILINSSNLALRVRAGGEVAEVGTRGRESTDLAHEKFILHKRVGSACGTCVSLARTRAIAMSHHSHAAYSMSFTLEPTLKRTSQASPGLHADNALPPCSYRFSQRAHPLLRDGATLVLTHIRTSLLPHPCRGGRCTSLLGGALTTDCVSRRPCLPEPQGSRA